MKNIFLKSSLLLFVLLNSLVIFASNLSNITVTSTSDNGSVGTLRWAINSSNSDPSITQIDFTSGLTGTLTLTSNLPQITNNISIIGPGANFFTISGANSYTMFSVAAGKTLTISGLKFTQNTSGTGTIFNADNSNFIASDIIVTNNNNGTAFFSANNSTITFSNSNFNNNSSYPLIGSDWGSTPSTTSSNLTDYSNRITVTNCSFTYNSGAIFSTERYVKIDNCNFSDNSDFIGIFGGVNRYQILNSNFTNNSGSTLFYFYSWIGDNSWGYNSTLSANNTLFDGNTFSGNSGTVINPGGNANYDAKTTITNNIFTNNGANWSGSPAVVSPNTLDNFINSVSHSLVNSTVTVTMNRAVFSSNNGTGQLDVNDFQFSLTGGNATLLSATPTSISSVGNVYTLGISISGTTNGMENLTVIPVANSIFDAVGNKAGLTQRNSSNFLSCIQTSSSTSIKLPNASTLVTTLSAQTNWTISGGLNQGLFSIANNNILNFNSVANYSNGSSNVYLVNVTNGCDTRNYTITISPFCGTWGEQGGDGLSQANPGESAYQIKRDYPNSVDGVYWINLPNVGPTQIYCIMNSAYDGGGWMLAMKVTRGTTFNYDANYWTSANTLNSTATNRNDGDAKFETMNNFEAKDMLAIWPDIQNIGSESGSIDNLSSWTWLQNNFHLNGTRTTLINKFSGSQVNYYSSTNGSMTYSGYGTPFSSQGGYTFYGINYFNNQSARIRWGFAWNNETDQNTNDVSGGIGMSGTYQNFSAGDVINCCQINHGINRSARVEVYIR